MSWINQVNWCPRDLDPGHWNRRRARVEQWEMGRCVCFIQDGGGLTGKVKTIEKITNKSTLGTEGPLLWDEALKGLLRRNHWRRDGRQWTALIQHCRISLPYHHLFLLLDSTLYPYLGQCLVQRNTNSFFFF